MIPLSFHNHSLHPCMGKFHKTNPDNPCKYSLKAFLFSIANGEALFFPLRITVNLNSLYQQSPKTLLDRRANGEDPTLSLSSPPKAFLDRRSRGEDPHPFSSLTLRIPPLHTLRSAILRGSHLSSLTLRIPSPYSQVSNPQRLSSTGGPFRQQGQWRTTLLATSPQKPSSTGGLMNKIPTPPFPNSIWLYSTGAPRHSSHLLNLLPDPCPPLLSCLFFRLGGRDSSSRQDRHSTAFDCANASTTTSHRTIDSPTPSVLEGAGEVALTRLGVPNLSGHQAANLLLQQCTKRHRQLLSD